MGGNGCSMKSTLFCGVAQVFGFVSGKNISQEDLDAHCSSLAVLIILQMMCLTSQSTVSGYSFQLCFLVPPFFCSLISWEKKKDFYEPIVDGNVGTHPYLPSPQTHCTAVERVLPCSGLPVGKPHPYTA